jgi:ankyrin repeat protein
MPVKPIAVALLAMLAGGLLAAQSLNDALRAEAERWQTDPKTVRALIARGADPNAVAADGKTPLIAAVTVVGGDNLSAMRVLLASGANPNAPGREGTALCEAISNSSSSGIDKDNMVVLLLRHGADPNVRCRFGNPPLDGAIMRHSDNLVAMLIGAGARVSDLDGDGTPLIVKAAIYGPKSIVRRMLDAGADINARGRRGETALKSAKNPHIAKFMRERGARD